MVISCALKPLTNGHQLASKLLTNGIQLCSEAVDQWHSVRL